MVIGWCDGGMGMNYGTEGVGFTSLWSVVSSVDVKVFEDYALLG